MTNKEGRNVKWYEMWPNDINEFDMLDLPGNN